MKNTTQLEEKELNELLKDFYTYFKDPFDFEEFLKHYLLKLGLDEVSTTKKTRDQGIDLEAKRMGLGSLSEIDAVNYHIQAKRYKQDRKISGRMINELKGTLKEGYKGIFITTSFFTKDAFDAASSDPSRPIVLIDGAQLINSCIDIEMGFVYKPIFSKKQMDIIMETDKESKEDRCLEQNQQYVEKTITKNDIRARILSVPSRIVEKYELKPQEYIIVVNGIDSYNVKYNPNRKYFSGITKLYKKYGIIDDDKVTYEKKCKWFLTDENIKIEIE